MHGTRWPTWTIGGLILERGDLRPGEHVEPPALAQGPQQKAHAFAAGREHEAAEAQLVVLPADGKVRQALRADHVAAVQNRLGCRCCPRAAGC